MEAPPSENNKIVGRPKCLSLPKSNDGIDIWDGSNMYTSICNHESRMVLLNHLERTYIRGGFWHPSLLYLAS